MMAMLPKGKPEKPKRPSEKKQREAESKGVKLK